MRHRNYVCFLVFDEDVVLVVIDGILVDRRVRLTAFQAILGHQPGDGDILLELRDWSE